MKIPFNDKRRFNAEGERIAKDPPSDKGTGKSAAEVALERARGHLYSFHQMIGKADLELDEVLELLRACGEEELAERIRARTAPDVPPSAELLRAERDGR